MVAIFASTTTWLSKDFMGKIPLSILTNTIENVKSISGVDCKKVKGDLKLTGQWQDLVAAYSVLEHCLEINSVDYDENDCETKPEYPDQSIIETEQTVSLVDEEICIKKEKDDDWQENDQHKDTDSKRHRKRSKIEYADEDDTQDIDYDHVIDIKEDINPDLNLEEELQEDAVPKKLQKGHYKCSKCSYTGKLEKHLINHMTRKHHRKFKCNDCGKKYGYKADLARHKSEVHTENRDQYFCKICNKYLKTKGYIEDHMQLHNDNYVYHCKACEKSFSTKLIFAKHVKIKHPKTKSIIDEIEDLMPTATTSTDVSVIKDENTPIDSGNDSTNSDDKKPEFKHEPDPEMLMMNIISADDDDKILHETSMFKVSLKRGRNRGRPRIKSYYDGRTEFPCHLCDYIGKKECHLEYHIKRNHSQKLICDICNKQFGYNWDLKRHREQVHAQASYFCHICSKAYKVKKSFDEHLKSHEDGYVKSRYPCTECEKSFSAKQVLENHIKFKHLGVKQKEKQRYLCQTCGQEFYHKYSYQSHMNKHQGLMPFNCDICGKAFASEHSVREHQIVHKNTRNHCCQQCAKTFKTSSALKAHEAIHSSSKDFKCDVCDKGFVQKQSLLRHERIHSGYKPYKCKLCERPFTDSATVRKHMILVHKKDPHNWQGDVLSDLKRPREFWPEDWGLDVIKAKKSADSLQEQNAAGGQPSQDSEITTILYTDNSAMQPLPDTLQSEHAMISHISNPQNTEQSGSLSMVQPSAIQMQALQNAHLPLSSIPSSLEQLTPVHMTSSHMSVPNSAVEMAAASILNLSAHLPPLPNPMGHLTSVQHMDGQMPSILNLSTMQNMNFNHPGST